MKHLIVGRFGAGDTFPVSGGTDEILTELKFIAANKRLDHGIGQALADLRKMKVFPTEIGIDVLILAAHVHAADTRISRATQSQDAWTREFGLTVPVSDVNLWNSTLPVLQRMLNFLTGDRWSITFRKRPSGLEIFGGERPSDVPLPTFDEVSLFSGGLDSLAGAIDSLQSGRVPLLVSHAGEGATSDAQTTVYSALQKAYPDSPFDRLRLWMNFPKDLISKVASEETTRGRSFLFFALGVFAGTGLSRAFKLQVPENGLIALNIPLDPLRLGALSTRTTHPFYIARWNDLLQLLQIEGRVENPYWNKTKGEMLSGSKNGALLRELASDSLSCASPTKGRWKGHGIEHCGYCLPCLIRRAAIRSAFGSDGTTYGTALAKGEVLDTKKAQGQQVRSFQFAIDRLQRDPSLASILIHKPGPLSDESADHLSQLAGVYVRGLDEVAAILADVKAQPDS